MKTYEAAQFHFHAPSEHTVNGKQYDLCIHTVNVLTSANSDNGRQYAVLGYLFEKDDYAPDMPWLAKLIKDLPAADGTVTTEFDWESFSAWVPNRGSYWHYEGGLTTPGCGEVVNWHINQQIFKINPTQLAVFNNMWAKSSYNPLTNLNGNGLQQGNNRPPMGVGARLVHQGSVEYEVGNLLQKKANAFVQWVLVPICCLLCLGSIGAAVVMSQKAAAAANGGQAKNVEL